MNNKYLPKSLFAIQLSVIAALFLMFAMITGSMTWADSKLEQQAMLETNAKNILRMYHEGTVNSSEKPLGLKFGPPHLRKAMKKIGDNSHDNVEIYHMIKHHDEFWLQVNNDTWIRMTNENFFYIWAKHFVPKIVIMMLLIAMSALFLSRTIKKPLDRLTKALSEFQRTRRASMIEETGPEELINVTRQMNAMMKEISTFETQRELVLAGVAHDIRTPLSRIRVAIEMIPQLSDDKRNALVNDIEQINHLQSQFLDYTRADNIKEMKDIDVGGIVMDCASQYPTDQITLHLSKEKMLVRGEASQLHRAINNVLSNAFKYGKPPVEIVTEIRNDRAVIIISDQGAGVREDELAYLTQPLYRCDAARSDCEGTGLGLSIVARCVDQMGGELVIAKLPNAGLQVELSFPYEG
ncbi:MAG: ATP-binding protein [Gammaproteobacteria bacterium]